MNLTQEQQLIVETISKQEEIFMSVEAVSGAGKTSLLKAIVDKLKPNNALYIAYNAAIAKEAASKFPSAVECKTTHSLAYANTVRPFKLKVGYFTYRNIKDRVDYEIKLEVVNFINKYCLSDYTSVENYIADVSTSSVVWKLAIKYMELMQSGKIECTHDFYLKFYHLLLAGKHIEHEEFDLLMLDEAGDLNPVTLAIFRLLPAKKRIMVGDRFQNIYVFNNTINGFEKVQDEATIMKMTKSFRVSDTIAPHVESFCRKFMDPNFEFKGLTYSDKELTNIQTSAFISRTNGSLISEMIRYNKRNVPYNLTRPVDQIFKLPRTLISLKPGKFISPEFKHLQEDTDYYYKEFKQLSTEYRSLYSYLLAQHPDDLNLKSAINLITTHSPSGIIEAYEYAKSHEHKNHNLTLCTAHSSKGLEFDHVHIADDMDTMMSRYADLPIDKRTPEETAEINLYYVAVTRAKKSIYNAEYLKFYKDL